MEYLDLVCQETSDSQNPTLSSPAERRTRQAVQAGPDRLGWSPSGGLQIIMQQVAPAHDRFICHEAQQVASVCVTGTGSPGHSGGCARSAMGGSRRIRLAASSHFGQSGGEVAGLPAQENISDCSGAAQHSLVLGSSGHVHPNPTEPTQPVDSPSIGSLTEI